jgi:hypothetical protein
MPRIRVHDYSISLDGYGAGPNQSKQEPLGVGGEDLHQWVTPTRSWQQAHGRGGEGGSRCLCSPITRGRPSTWKVILSSVS